VGQHFWCWKGIGIQDGLDSRPFLQESWGDGQTRPVGVYVTRGSALVGRELSEKGRESAFLFGRLLDPRALSQRGCVVID
jgi:hypothetical protein